MIKKQIVAGLFLLFIAPLSLFAIDVHIGLRGEGAISRAYGDIGLYSFNGTLKGTQVDAIRSTSQMVQFSGGVGLFVQMDFTSWYTLMPEVMVAFNRGLSYSGNYMAAVIVNAPAYPELTGEMRYSWQALNVNILSQFNVVRATEDIAIYLLAGPSLSVKISKVTERFNPDFGVSNAPEDQAYSRKLAVEQWLDAGVIAGIGTQVDFGAWGRLTVDFRTAWYFIPQLTTHISPDQLVRMSVPLSIHLGYAIKVH